MKSNNFVYKCVVVGGTFDHLHTGHTDLLSKAFELGELVVIGITTDTFVASKLSLQSIQNYAQRVSGVREHLASCRFLDRCEIIPIDDMYGTTLSDDRIQAIVISPETRAGADLVNQARAEKGLAELAIESIDLVQDQSDLKLSSTRIRQGLVDSRGKVFANLFAKDIPLDPQYLLELKPPMGQLCKHEQIIDVLDQHKPNFISVVGDASLDFFISHKLDFDLAVIDGFTKRMTFTHTNLPQINTLTATNPAGKITKDAVMALKYGLESPPSLVRIDGEEDLLSLALILLQPLGSVVCYGQPDEGMVLVEVNPQSKAKWYQFLKKAGKIV